MHVRWVAVALCCLSVAAARAQSVAVPNIRTNDTWTYQETTETRTAGWHQTHLQFRVTRGGGSLIGLQTQVVGSNIPPTDVLARPDWSRFRDVNGHETVVNRPFAFPLSVGKTWTVEYAEDNPNRAHSKEHVKEEYEVVGWEDVQVPAGAFHAIKVEAQGEWQATVAPATVAGSGARVDPQGTTATVRTNRIQSRTAGGRLLKQFWYVPEVKRWAKREEEYFDSNGVRNERYSDVLETYHVAE